MKRFISILTLLAFIAVVLVLPACNTTKGVGTDIERAGSGLKRSAEKNGAQ